MAARRRQRVELQGARPWGAPPQAKERGPNLQGILKHQLLKAGLHQLWPPLPQAGHHAVPGSTHVRRLLMYCRETPRACAQTFAQLSRDAAWTVQLTLANPCNHCRQARAPVALREVVGRHQGLHIRKDERPARRLVRAARLLSRQHSCTHFRWHPHLKKQLPSPRVRRIDRYVLSRLRIFRTNTSLPASYSAHWTSFGAQRDFGTAFREGGWRDTMVNGGPLRYKQKTKVFSAQKH